VVIVALGSRGDVEPYIALGKGLKRAGHYVRVISHQNFDSLVSSHGLEFWAIKGNVQEIAQSTEMSERIERGSFLSVLSKMRKAAETQAKGAIKTGVEACQGMDIVLAGVGGLLIATPLAEKFNIPLFQAYYIPFTPTAEFPSFLFSKLPQWLGGSVNRFSYHVMRQLMWQGFRSTDKLIRKQLDLPASSFWGPYKSLQSQKFPVLYGYSPSLIPPALDWDANTYVTGFWFLDEPSDWKPPQDLLDFLEAGSPPIYIGFGSMSSRNPEKTANLVLSALNETKQRAIILSGWNGLKKTDLPSSVFMVDSVPFSWLFPKMAAVVHHGGAGTTHYGVRAGVPSIIIPFFADQPFWGNRIKKLGIGPDPIPRKKLTAKKLAKTIGLVLTDSAMRLRAAELGRKLHEEKGNELAVKLISSQEGNRSIAT
jgi:UDP:flavonoid glycosyltransferase YjiC (YdhE family)